MRFELFIALRYLFTRREQKFISVTSWVSVFGVALGVAALIVVMGVMNGFTTDLRDKIIGVTSHIILFNHTGHVQDDPALLATIRAVPGVSGATPFIYSELMVSSAGGGKGIVLRGIDPDTASSALGVLEKLTEGSVAALKEQGSVPGVLVGKEMARRLGLLIGSRVNMMAPQGRQSSAGFAPRIQAFRVVGIFSVGMFEYDSSLAFVTLDSARALLGWPDTIVTGIEVAVRDVYKAETIATKVIDAIGSNYYAQTWMTMNANLFAALQLEKHAMGVILFLVVLVGAFSIITSLVMMVMEKTRDIAILMSLGATRVMVRRIFTLQGLLIGFFGTALGFVLGLGTCWLLSKYQFIKLPRGVYSLDYLPVLIHGQDLVVIGITSMLICYAATLYPSRKAASLEPVEALRHE